MRDMDVKLLTELNRIIPEPAPAPDAVNDTRSIEPEETTKTVRRTKK